MEQSCKSHANKINWEKWGVIVSLIGVAVSLISVAGSFYYSYRGLQKADEQTQKVTTIATKANSGIIINAEKMDSIVVEQKQTRNEVNTINTKVENLYQQNGNDNTMNIRDEKK